jgi:integrase
MATIERRGDRFRLIFYHLGKRYTASLRTSDRREADAIAGGAERTLMLLEQGVLDLPEGADLVSFALTGGKRDARPKPPTIRTFAELRDLYLQAHETGAVEANSLATVRMHLGHFARTLGNSFPVPTLAQVHVQQHIDRRARQKGIRHRPLSPTTLKKEVASLRACWNWAVSASLVSGAFPTNKNLKYPKAQEKEHFQTREEIERKIRRGGMPDADVKELWDCLFLTLPEVDDFLRFAEATARHEFLYPMCAFAAHTGARRSEMLRVRLDDVDFAGGTVLIRERKRDRSQRTFRRVPLSPLLERILRDWVARHPGGQYLFCHRLEVSHSKKRRTTFGPLTRDEAHDHFKRLVGGSKWDVMRGWHVFRHSFASNCAAQGADQRWINGWLGHQTEEMVRRYRHLIPDQQKQAIRLVFGQGE